MSLNLNPMLMQLVESGVQVTLLFNTDTKQVKYDLNTLAKSHMHATENPDGSLTLNLRYEEVEVVRDFAELLRVANYARHGREFMNAEWARLLRENDAWQ